MAGFGLDPNMMLAYKYLPDAASADLIPEMDSLHTTPRALVEGTDLVGASQQPNLEYGATATGSFVKLQTKWLGSHKPTAHGLFLTRFRRRGAFGLRCVFLRPVGNPFINPWAVSLLARDGGTQEKDDALRTSATFRVKGKVVDLNAPLATIVSRTGFPSGTMSIGDRAFGKKYAVKMELRVDPGRECQASITMLRPGWGAGSPIFDTARLRFNMDSAKTPQQFTTVGVALVVPGVTFNRPPVRPISPAVSVDLLSFEMFV